MLSLHLLYSTAIESLPPYSMMRLSVYYHYSTMEIHRSGARRPGQAAIPLITLPSSIRSLALCRLPPHLQPINKLVCTPIAGSSCGRYGTAFVWTQRLWFKCPQHCRSGGYPPQNVRPCGSFCRFGVTAYIKCLPIVPCTKLSGLPSRSVAVYRERWFLHCLTSACIVEVLSHWRHSSSAGC